MIQKCEHAGCTKAGTCRAPKDRTLREYWHFCTEHAAEYNKNWNYYEGMSPEEIEADWESQTFGAPLNSKTKSHIDAADYAKFINDFLTGRDSFDHAPQKPKMASNIVSAFKKFDLPITASWREVATRYRVLAKKYHPDTAHNKDGATSEFTAITAAYETLKKHFGK